MLAIPSALNTSQWTTSGGAATNGGGTSNVVTLGERTFLVAQATYSVSGTNTYYYTTTYETTEPILTTTFATTSAGTQTQTQTQTTTATIIQTTSSTASSSTTSTEPLASLFITAFGNFGMWDLNDQPVYSSPLELLGVMPYGLVPAGGGKEAKKIGYDISYEVTGDNIDWSTLEVKYQVASAAAQGDVLVGSVTNLDSGIRTAKSGKLTQLKFPIEGLLTVPVDKLDKTKPLQIALSILPIASAYPVGAEHTTENLLVAVPRNADGSVKPTTAVGTLVFEETGPVIVVDTGPKEKLVPAAAPAPEPPPAPPPEAPKTEGPAPTPSGITWAHGKQLTAKSKSEGDVSQLPPIYQTGRYGLETKPGVSSSGLPTRFDIFGNVSSFEIYGAETASISSLSALFWLAVALGAVGVLLYFKRDELEDMD
jgi:hypothetical protein